VLYLQAHFITELPDITPLLRSLVYLNLSFNDFVVSMQPVLFAYLLLVLRKLALFNIRRHNENKWTNKAKLRRKILK